MRIPSPEETIEYFSRYGLQISPISSRHSSGWKVSAPDLPLDERRFPSLGALWLEWMEYVAERLSTEYRVKRFMACFENSNPKERRVLLSAVDNYSETLTGPLQEMFKDLPPPSIDHLLDNWQNDFEQIWEHRDYGFCFALRVEDEIKRLQEKPANQATV